MLVFLRKRFQSIVINNDIIITVVDIRDDKVRLGIVAPRDVPIHRQEVYDAIHGDFAVSALPLQARVDDTEDLLPDLIVECRLALGSQGLAQFTPEGGFFFPDKLPARHKKGTKNVP